MTASRDRRVDSSSVRWRAALVPLAVALIAFGLSLRGEYVTWTGSARVIGGGKLWDDGDGRALGVLTAACAAFFALRRWRALRWAAWVTAVFIVGGFLTEWSFPECGAAALRGFAPDPAKPSEHEIALHPGPGWAVLLLGAAALIAFGATRGSAGASGEGEVPGAGAPEERQRA